MENMPFLILKSSTLQTLMETAKVLHMTLKHYRHLVIAIYTLHTSCVHYQTTFRLSQLHANVSYTFTFYQKSDNVEP